MSIYRSSAFSASLNTNCNQASSLYQRLRSHRKPKHPDLKSDLQSIGFLISRDSTPTRLPAAEETAKVLLKQIFHPWSWSGHLQCTSPPLGKLSATSREPLLTSPTSGAMSKSNASSKLWRPAFAVFKGQF